MTDIVINHIGGKCPVQAEGLINGEPFYFRARWKRWQFGIGKDPVGVILGRCEGFYRAAPRAFNAGYMPLDEAINIIRKCAKEFTDGQAGSGEADLSVRIVPE